MRYPKTILSLLPLIALITILTLAFAQTALAYNFSIFHTLDSDFNGTNSQTTLDTGNGRIKLSYEFVCGTSSVSYGGVTYNTLYQVGNTQCWLGKNLNVGNMLANVNTLPSDPFAYSNIQKWCYDNSTTNCTNEGGLYTWAEAMGLPSSCLTTDCTGSISYPHQGICPSGWHIPTDSEWYALENDLKTVGQSCDPGRSAGGCDGASAKMQPGGSSGLEMRLSGMRRTIPDYSSLGTVVDMQSSTQVNATTAVTRRLFGLVFSTLVWRYAGLDKTQGESVRCMKDIATPIYYSSGTYTSPILPAGGAANWNSGTVAWTRVLNSQPEITLKARSCSTSSESSCVNYATGWGVCNNLAGSNPANLSGSGCTTNLHRFIQYQVGLSSTDGTATPTFDDITFNYDIVPDVSFLGGFKFLGSVKFW